MSDDHSPPAPSRLISSGDFYHATVAFDGHAPLLTLPPRTLNGLPELFRPDLASIRWEDTWADQELRAEVARRGLPTETRTP